MNFFKPQFIFNQNFYSLAFLLVAVLTSNAQTNFITKWNLSYPGVSPNQINFGVVTTGTVNYTWQELSPGSSSGSGSFTGTNAAIPGLPANSIIRLEIAPANFTNIHMNFAQDENRLVEIIQWGTVAWSSMSYAFWQCAHLQCTATDIPDLSGVLDMSGMFNGCSSLNGPANIGSWDISTVNDISYMFSGATAFNQPIGGWNTSNVNNMSFMFYAANSFNQPLSVFFLIRLSYLFI